MMEISRGKLMFHTWTIEQAKLIALHWNIISQTILRIILHEQE